MVLSNYHCTGSEFPSNFEVVPKEVNTSSGWSFSCNGGLVTSHVMNRYPVPQKCEGTENIL